MKRKSFFTPNNHGFILPYVLFVISLALIIIVSNLNLYQSEMYITHNQTEQLKVETLLQMANTTFRESVMSGNNPESPTFYHFPYGEVKIDYLKLSDTEYHLYFTISTDSGAALRIPHRTFITRNNF